jgi:pimeloyl-ACP methyl ester carboxylesterase
MLFEGAHLAKADVNGLSIAYEVIGSGSQGVVITPGGRFSKDTPGIRELATELASAGMKVLIWDRVNAGESDVHFTAESESLLNADTLGGLLRRLGFGPTLVVGGSAGSRVSLMTAIRHPDTVSGLFLLWISGGPIGLGVLASHYHYDSAHAALTGGMEAVANLPTWQESLARNPGNRARILAQNPVTFVQTMQQWAKSFLPTIDTPVPGVTPEQLRQIKVPTVVLRSGTTDVHHTRETSEKLATLIPSARLIEPPWGDNEWNERMLSGEPLFARWPKLAPLIVEAASKIKG